MPEVIPHICWNKMEEDTIIIRLDAAEEGVEYRAALDGHPWTGPSEDGLYRFKGAEAGKRYVISCERLGEGGWEEACSPVTLNFVPPVQRIGPMLFSMELPKGGGEDETVWREDRTVGEAVSGPW